jgi:hypothetical protein
MIVQISVPSKKSRQPKATFVIDWDRAPAPWNQICPEIALSLDELARRGAGWVKVEEEASR